jgi:hypothetical protein
MKHLDKISLEFRILMMDKDGHDKVIMKILDFKELL